MHYNQSILAHVHIEKAAGQTFTSILENNFKWRHCRVKPFKKSDKGIFTADCMRILFLINPFVRAISGHSVKPFSDLDTIVPQIKYITLMRNPIPRYISHFQYQVEKMKRTFSFEEFLDNPMFQNFQTKKIAGDSNVERAKKILSKKFYLVGVVEEFDDFLEVLQLKLFPQRFDTTYQHKNVGNKKKKNEILKSIEKYREVIKKNNILDMELYQYAKNRIFEKEKRRLIDHKHINLKNMAKDYSRFPELKESQLWKLYRSIYYLPLAKTIRFLNGLPPSGSY